jgi:nicotinamide-nucleotide amidase
MYNEDNANAIKKILVSKEESIAVAESVTAGHLQAALSTATEAAQYFQGGITCYNLPQKTRHLNVNPIVGEKHNAVHQVIANELAQGVCELFLSDYGIGITGYASLMPQQEEEGIYAYCSIAYKKKIIIEKRLTSNKDKPLEVQLDYTNQILKLLKEYLENTE